MTGGIVDYGIALSHCRPASLRSLAGRYDNPMPDSTIFAIHGLLVCLNHNGPTLYVPESYMFVWYDTLYTKATPLPFLYYKFWGLQFYFGISKGFKRNMVAIKNNFLLNAKFLKMHRFLSICIQNLQKVLIWPQKICVSSKLALGIKIQRILCRFQIRWNGLKFFVFQILNLSPLFFACNLFCTFFGPISTNLDSA